MIIWGSQIFGNAAYVVETLDLVMGLKKAGVDVRLIPYENLHYYYTFYLSRWIRKSPPFRRLLLSAGHAGLALKPLNRLLERAIEPFGSFSWDLTSAAAKDRTALREMSLYYKHCARKIDLRAEDPLIYISLIMATGANIRAYFRTVDENLRYLSRGGMPRRVYHIGRFMFETDRIHPDCIEFINRFDEVWVPSRFCRDVYLKCGLTRPVFVMPESLDTDLFRPEAPPLPVPGKRGFNFLTVLNRVSPRTFNGQRKGWRLLLRAFLGAFRKTEDVALILKISDDRETRNMIRKEIMDIMGRETGTREIPPHILLFAKHLSPEAMPGLYRSADAYVMPTRGEGWGRPFMEAMGMGLPAIGTGWGGHRDYMDQTNAYLIDYRLVSCPARFRGCGIPLAEGHRWAEPSEDHLRRILRDVFENKAQALEKARKARQDILTGYNRQAVADMMRRRLGRISEKERLGQK